MRYNGFKSLLMVWILFFFPPSLFADCPCYRAPLDLVFVIDRSNSMVEEIQEVKTKLQEMVALIQKHTPSLRVGVISYESTVEMTDLTKDFSKVAKFLQDIDIYGGVELVDKALEVAVHDMSWDPRAKKIIILIGDEPPNNYRKGFTVVNGCLRSYEMAEKAKAKGIVVHTISTVQLPINMSLLTHQQKMEWAKISRDWAYIHHLRVKDPQEYARKKGEWQTRFSQFYTNASRTQNPNATVEKLPEFVTIAEKGGGKAIALDGTDKLMNSLLYVSTGVRYDLEQAKEVKKQPAGSSSSSGLVLAQIEHEGDWNPPRDFYALLEEASKKLNISARSEPVKVNLKEDILFRYPFIYLTGHKSFSFSVEQRERLQKHLSRGGFLMVDSCCAKEDFDRSVRVLLKQIFPQNPLKTIASSHAIYQNPFPVQEVTLSRVAMQNDMAKVSEYLEGVEYQGRLVVVYSSKCLGCGFGPQGGSVCGIESEDARKVFLNILFYSLTE